MNLRVGDTKGSFTLSIECKEIIGGQGCPPFYENSSQVVLFANRLRQILTQLCQDFPPYQSNPLSLSLPFLSTSSLGCPTPTGLAQ